jgi:hypothetical protein
MLTFSKKNPIHKQSKRCQTGNQRILEMHNKPGTATSWATRDMKTTAIEPQLFRPYGSRVGFDWVVCGNPIGFTQYGAKLVGALSRGYTPQSSATRIAA